MASHELKPTAESRVPSSAGFALEAACLSDRGKLRAANEDSGSVTIPDDPIELSRKGALLVVADGMGGHHGGQLASRMAVDLVRAHYYESPAPPAEALPAAVRAANREIFRHAQSSTGLTGMGTTCTAVAVARGLAWVAHVGDSRLYLVRDGNPYRMTQDHSATMEMVKAGALTLAEADHHEDRNIILRAVGTREKVEVATWEDPFPLRAGDRLVLCSDGAYETIPDQEIAGVCFPRRRAADACAGLVRIALERDGSDNITVAVLSVLDTGPEVRP